MYAMIQEKCNYSKFYIYLPTSKKLFVTDFL